LMETTTLAQCDAGSGSHPHHLLSRVKRTYRLAMSVIGGKADIKSKAANVRF